VEAGVRAGARGRLKYRGPQYHWGSFGYGYGKWHAIFSHHVL